MKRWIKHNSVLCIAVITLWGGLASAGHAQEFDVEVIATTGGVAPGAAGKYKGDVLGLSVSNAGVAFTYLVTNAKGEESRVLVFSNGDSTKLVVETGTGAPCDFAGKIDGKINHIATPAINNRGQIAFYGVGKGGKLRPTGAIFRINADGTGLASLLRGNCSTSVYPLSSDAVFPDGKVPPKLRLRSPPVFTAAVLNEAGQVPFDTILPNLFDQQDTASPVHQNAGLFISDGTKAGAAMLVQKSQVPNGLAGVTEPKFDSSFVAIDVIDNGQVLFSANLAGVDTASGAALTDETNSILAMTANGEDFKLIVREGTAIPGREGYFGPAKPRRLWVNNKEQVVFYSGDMSGTAGGKEDDAGIFVWGPTGVTQELVSKNAFVDPADQAKGKFADFSEFSQLTDSGLVAFYAEIKDTEEGGRGLFIGDINTQTFTEILRAGDAGGSKGMITNFPNNGSPFSINKDSREFAINESGQLFFVADVDVDDGPKFELEDTLFFYDPEHGLVEALRKGTPFAGGVLDKIKINRGELDDAGRCVIRFELVDGTKGIAFVKPRQNQGERSAH